MLALVQQFLMMISWVFLSLGEYKMPLLVKDLERVDQRLLRVT